MDDHNSAAKITANAMNPMTTAISISILLYFGVLSRITTGFLGIGLPTKEFASLSFNRCSFLSFSMRKSFSP